MTNPIKIELGGKERIIRFNQYANIELYKLLFDNGFESPDMSLLLDKCNNMIKQNYMLFYKALIYSGIVGNDYASNLFKPSASIEEVGEWVGQMSQEELTEFFMKVWNTFFEEMGVNLEKIKELEAEDTTTEKKK
jgi:hypothetical protein